MVGFAMHFYFRKCFPYSWCPKKSKAVVNDAAVAALSANKHLSGGKPISYSSVRVSWFRLRLGLSFRTSMTTLSGHLLRHYLHSLEVGGSGSFNCL